MALLAVLQSDSRTLALLQSVLGEEHQLLTCSSWEQLQDLVRNHAVEGCVVDVYGVPETVTFGQLQSLRRRQPPVAIVVHADFSGRELDLFELGRLDIDGVIMARQEDARAIRETVSQALGAVVALRVTEALRGRLTEAGRDCLGWAVENASSAPTVGELAQAFALTPRSLGRELRIRGLPPPGDFLLWGRLFRAAYLLQGGRRTVEETAFALGYSSGAALGRAFRRKTGHAPTAVGERGGVAWVMESFLRACGARSRERGGWLVAPGDES